MAEDEFLRVHQAAALLHVAPKTLSRWANEGKIACVRTAGGHRRFSRAEVERLRAQLQRPDWTEPQP
jgi:excisionase family DNA binding protein